MSSSNGSQKRYSRDEMNAILARALESTSGDGISHTELLDVGRELGIAPGVLEAAAIDVVEREKDSVTLSRWRRTAWRRFSLHLVAYLFVIGIVAVTAGVEGGTFLPAIIVALAWGIGLASHALGVFFPDEHKIIDRHRAREEKRQRARKVRVNQVRERVRVEPAAGEGVDAEAQAGAEESLDARDEDESSPLRRHARDDRPGD